MFRIGQYLLAISFKQAPRPITKRENGESHDLEV